MTEQQKAPVFMPGKLKYVTGDCTIPGPSNFRLVIHIVNDLGVFGSGVSGAIGRRWPKAMQEYKAWYRGQTNFKGGQIKEVQMNSDLSVVHMLAQHGIMAQNKPEDPPIRYDQLAQCLEKVAALAKEHSASVHAPRFGAGLASGVTEGYSEEAWKKVEQLITEKLINKGISVTIYDLPKKKENL
jgi:O-acetyl-ADP-ribose deacetylase (regulator of RNase III)